MWSLGWKQRSVTSMIVLLCSSHDQENVQTWKHFPSKDNKWQPNSKLPRVLLTATLQNGCHGILFATTAAQGFVIEWDICNSEWGEFSTGLPKQLKNGHCQVHHKGPWHLVQKASTSPHRAHAQLLRMLNMQLKPVALTHSGQLASEEHCTCTNFTQVQVHTSGWSGLWLPDITVTLLRCITWCGPHQSCP